MITLARQLPYAELGPLSRHISDAGYGAELTQRLGIASTMAAFVDAFGDPDRRRAEHFITEVAADTARHDSTLAPTRIGRLTTLAWLLEVLGPGDHRFGVADQAIPEHPDLARYVVRMAARQADDLGRLAAEARRTAPMLADEPLHTIVLLHLAPNPLDASSPRPPIVEAGDAASLRACLRSGNDWLFWLAAEWLETDDGGVDVLWRELLSLPARHRGAIAAWVADRAGRREEVSAWLDGDDPTLRVAAARLIAQHAPDTQPVPAACSRP